MTEEILLEIKEEMAAMNHHLNEIVKALHELAQNTFQHLPKPKRK